MTTPASVPSPSNSESHESAGGQESPHDSSKYKDDHVCGCQSQTLTGWAAVEKTLNDYDKQEVGGYKEDIDSLLTFAGLYSGILTAFVLVSYTQLSDDSAAETVKYLQIITHHIVNNSDGQPTNSTAAMPSPSSPFQPSLSAKRVNVLWFASLVVSLSTASLAILVKQWLRMYMSLVSSSPQGQLRIREFRQSGLKHWRVFGIASMLPLLLQLSLALFFVGLCFFTANADPMIAYTTIPLVSGWAFLLITFTAAPIFSASCPYQTPALSTITTALRIHIWHNIGVYIAIFLDIAVLIAFVALMWPILYAFSLIRLVITLVVRLPRSLVLFRGSASEILRSVPRVGHVSSFTELVSQLLSWLVCQSISWLVCQLLGRPVLRTDGSLQPEPADSITQLFDITHTVVFQWLHNAFESAIESITAFGTRLAPAAVEERSMLHDASKDLDVLVAADIAQANPTPDLAIIEDTLRRCTLSWDKALLFFIRILGNHVSLSVNDKPALVDCTPLAPATRDRIRVLFRQYVLDPTILPTLHGVPTRELEKEEEKALWIYVSLHSPNFELPHVLDQFIDVLLSKAQWKFDPRNDQSFLQALALMSARIIGGYTTTEFENLWCSGDLLKYLYGTGAWTTSAWKRQAERNTVLGDLYKKAAQHLANNMLKKSGYSIYTPSLVVGLCKMAQCHGMEIEFTDMLAPFVERAFSNSSELSKRCVVERVWGSLMPCMFLELRNDKKPNDSLWPQYQQFLMDCLEKQRAQGAPTLMKVLCLITECSCEDIADSLHHTHISLVLLKYYRRVFASTEDGTLENVSQTWGQIFVNLAYWITFAFERGQICSRLHPLFLRLNWDQSVKDRMDLVSSIELIKAIGVEIDAAQYPHPIPDYLCLTLGRLTIETTYERFASKLLPFTWTPPIWTARHFRFRFLREKWAIMETGLAAAKAGIPQGALPFEDAPEAYGAHIPVPMPGPRGFREWGIRLYEHISDPHNSI